MNNTIEYKGYIGSVEFLESEAIFYGKVQGIKTLIEYEGSTAKSFIKDFHEAINQYLSLCDAEGVNPEIGFKGTYNIRIKPELHKKLAIKALNENISLNQATENAIAAYVESC